MIKFVGLQDTEVQITDAYITNDRSALSIDCLHSLDDDDSAFKVFQFSKYGIFVVADDGIWSDFELMMPQFTEVAPCQFATDISKMTGYPLLCTDWSYNVPVVQDEGASFTLWFAESQVIDTIVSNDKAQFYFSGKQLVGIRVEKAGGEDA